MNRVDEFKSVVCDIEKAAEDKGWSINELCRRAGVDRSTFTRGKAGTVKWGFDTFQKLRDALAK